MDVGQQPPPFLSRSEEYQQPQELDDHEDSQPRRVSHTPFPQILYPPQLQPRQDLMSSIQWHWILLGIVIGALLMNMRPVIIKGSP
jgi:hypothetical protein